MCVDIVTTRAHYFLQRELQLPNHVIALSNAKRHFRLKRSDRFVTRRDLFVEFSLQPANGFVPEQNVGMQAAHHVGSRVECLLSGQNLCLVSAGFLTLLRRQGEITS